MTTEVEVWPRVQVDTVQGQNSKTFVSPPPLTGLTYPEVLDYNHDNNPTHPHFVYAHPETNVPVEVTWRETIEAAWRVTHIVRKAVGEWTTKPKFAVLAVADTISYTTTVNGTVRAGFESFLVSPRMSAPIIAQMLEAQGTTHVFVSRDPGMQGLITGIKEILGDYKITVLQMPIFEEIFTSEPVERPPSFKPKLSEVSIIIHSSGSTSVPKRVPYTYRSFAVLSPLCHHSEIDACFRLGWHVLPMFHLLGVGGMGNSAHAGATLSVYPPKFPPVTPTPDSALAHLVYTQCKAVVFPPIILHALMAMKPKETIEVLKTMTTVGFGGGSLNRAVGDALQKGGVTLGNLYGMTETLCSTMFLPLPIPNDDWEWMRLHKATRIHYRPLDETNTTFEPIIMESEWHWNNINNVEIDGVKGYATNDVCIRHPTANAIRLIGRIDDQIVLSSGEKTNPVPLEHILMTDPHIGLVITFGRGRPHGGIIIQPKPQFAIDGRDPAQVKAFREKIAPTMKKMNDFAPSHSRIAPEMILVTSPDRPFVLTAKGTPLRKDAFAKYDADINAAYEAFEAAADTHFDAPEDNTAESNLNFIRTVVHSILTSTPADTADVFQHGCDSLRAASIRNAIAKTLTKDQRKLFGRDAVYHNPTIERLAHAVLRIVSPEAAAASEANATQVKLTELQGMVTKYSADLPTHTGTVPPPNNKTVLVTGTTGGLGSNIVDRLLADETVERIYAINRSGTLPLRLRHEGAFKDRALNESALAEGVDSGRVRFIEADTSATKLGLTDEAYNEIASSVTHIIHNAWPVNYNYQLTTFEPSIRSVRSIIDLALASPFASPPRILYVSSVAVVRNVPSTVSIPEVYVEDPTPVIGLGYDESKWVAETILRRAAESTSLATVSVRVGQCSGGLNGNWNASEWIPSVIRSAKALGQLPDFGEEAAISWIRVHEAAQTLLELTYNSPYPVHHLTHATPVSWRAIFDAAGKQLGVPMVPYADWLATLEQHRTSVMAERDIPALRLLTFFRHLGANTRVECFHALCNKKTVSESPTLAAAAPLDEKDVAQWISYWKTTGALA